jgi:hypothetical protein
VCGEGGSLGAERAAHRSSTLAQRTTPSTADAQRVACRAACTQPPASISNRLLQQQCSGPGCHMLQHVAHC